MNYRSLDKEKLKSNLDDETGSSSSSKSSGSKDETVATAASSSNNSVSSQDSARFFSDYKFSGYNHPDEYFETSPSKEKYLLSFDDIEKGTTNTGVGHGDQSPSDSSKELILFGYDFSHLSPPMQFFTSAFGVFFFTILYGYLQELIQIHIAGRQLALFLATCQFGGYTFWSTALALMRRRKLQNRINTTKLNSYEYKLVPSTTETSVNNDLRKLPLLGFFAMAFIRAADLGLTNLSMKYLNYPAKTLIKSSRVIFTMIMGIIIGRKKYSTVDYVMVIMLVFGLSMFLHADMTSNAVFHPVGVAMLITSLSLDGAVSNWSEVIMNRHDLGQDEFHMLLYFFSFIIMFVAAYQTNEIQAGINFFFQTHGTMTEVQDVTNQFYTWSINDKTFALALFCTIGIFGGSCACAITKRFGALAMSVTTTARKATTIFLSFALFPNACTAEHIVGVLIFVSGLLLKGGLCNKQTTSNFWSFIRKSLPSSKGDIVR